MNIAIFKLDSRIRLNRPFSLTLFGLIFLFLPILNYFQIVYNLKINVYRPSQFFYSLNFFEIVLLFLPLLVGTGLLLVKKWGYWFFLIYSGLIISYNIFTLGVTPGAFNLGVLARTIFGVLAVYYFTRKDISAPYMKLYPRGWRGETRSPIHAKISVNGKELITRDLSPHGFYAEWNDPGLIFGKEVVVRISSNPEDIVLPGGVVRIDETGIGIAFRNLDKEIEQKIKTVIKENFQ